MTQTATISAKEAVLTQLREALGNGSGLYAAAPTIAQAMSAAELRTLWAEVGGEILYAWAIKSLGVQRRHTSGLPLGYSEDRAEYGRDRIEEVLSQWVGVLEGEAPHLVQMGALDAAGCLGAAANHKRLAKANGRQAARFRDLAGALTEGQAVRDMDRDAFISIWWAP